MKAVCKGQIYSANDVMDVVARRSKMREYQQRLVMINKEISGIKGKSSRKNELRKQAAGIEAEIDLIKPLVDSDPFFYRSEERLNWDSLLKYAEGWLQYPQDKLVKASKELAEALVKYPESGGRQIDYYGKPIIGLQAVVESQAEMRIALNKFCNGVERTSEERMRSFYSALDNWQNECQRIISSGVTQSSTSSFDRAQMAVRAEAVERYFQYEAWTGYEYSYDLRMAKEYMAVEDVLSGRADFLVE